MLSEFLEYHSGDGNLLVGAPPLRGPRVGNIRLTLARDLNVDQSNAISASAIEVCVVGRSTSIDSEWGHW